MHSRIPPEHYERLFEVRATLTERERILGRPVFEVFPDNPQTPEAQSTQKLGRSLRRVVATRSADVMAVQRYDVPRADGAGFELRYWSPVNAPVLGPSGEVLYIVHRVDDITDYMLLAEEQARLNAANLRMEAEIVSRNRELDRLNEELRGANEVLTGYARRTREQAARKDEFLAMLAHELRNPLSAITSALQLWQMGGTDQRRQQDLTAVLGRQVRNLTRMVDDLLDMSRIDRGVVELQRGPLDLRDVLGSAVQAACELYERHQVMISTTIAPAAYRMAGDATRLEQVLTNLLANAAKYSERGGKVEVTLEQVQQQGGPCARIEVRDHGRGIPADKLEAIFDIFVQVDVGLDRARGGLGIGLSLVRALVELHGGRVQAYSDGIGHGSRFVVWLPLTRAGGTPDERPATHIAAPVAPTGARRVVIVEDNADARQTLAALLAGYGHDVATAANGDEGVELITRLRPDVAIVDIGLPGIDGFEVARRVRRLLARDRTRLVALTGYSSSAVQSAALDSGFDLHVVKPCTPETLAAALAQRPPEA